MNNAFFPLKMIIKVFRRQDPPSIPQLAVPKEVPEMEQQLAYLTGNPKLQATRYLSIIAFYYLLRIGEYTKLRKVKLNGKLVRATRTQHFRVQDMALCKNGKILSRRESLNTLLEAESATLRFQFRKSGKWVKTYTMNQRAGIGL